ncbi:MAG TPA: RHS repeat-associated core domain-containing protein [Kofleriaceae bacterium]|nr:RHS repeat-associated core domain-containing protein [Kofleriaceae bacterium]
MKARRKSSAAGSALIALLVAEMVFAYPGDVMQNAGPSSAPARPDRSVSGDGASVSASGAAAYGIPITVPPGRQGMQPDLALGYSSAGAVRGGVAAGWSLGIPTIEVDTSQGRLGGTHYVSGLSGTRLVPVVEPGATSGVETFRAEDDATYTRYERIGHTDHSIGHWRALTADGRIIMFGDVPDARDQLGAAGEGRWFVTRMVDRFGNRIDYHYEKVLGFILNGGFPADVDIAPTRIEYGANDGAGLGHHARIDFEYRSGFDLCPGSKVPIGAEFSYRTGLPLYRGARRLMAVSTHVLADTRWQRRRRVALSYDETELTCPTGRVHAPLRLLTAVTETGYAPDGAATTLPPTTFEYGRRERELTRVVPSPSPAANLTFGAGASQLNLMKAGGWPTIDFMFVDFDGDGVLDLLESRPRAHATECGFRWHRNLGGSFAPPVDGTFPTMPWAADTRNDDDSQPDFREGCSLAAQFNRRVRTDSDLECNLPGNYMSYRMMDVTGDGRPDLVTAIDAKKGDYLPELDEKLWDGNLPPPQPAPGAMPMPNQDPECPDEEKGACFDKDGNRAPCNPLTPLPSSIPLAPGQGGPGGCPAGQCPSPNCFMEPCPCLELCSGGGLTPVATFQSPVEDTLLCRVDGCEAPWMGAGTPGPMQVDDLDSSFIGAEQPGSVVLSGYGDANCAYHPETRCGRFVWRVYDNQGDGTLSQTARIVYSPVPLETDRPTSKMGVAALAAASSWHGFLDIDGDGFLDAVFQNPVFWDDDHYNPPPMDFQVFRGDGQGGFQSRPDGTPYLWPVPKINVGSVSEPVWNRARVHAQGMRQIVPQATVNGVETKETFEIRETETIMTLMDVNGDGLPDYVDHRHWGPVPEMRVFFNTGAGFEDQGYGTALNAEPIRSFDATQHMVLGRHENRQIESGWSRARRRAVDLDGDGLMDMVELTALTKDYKNPWVINPRGTRYAVRFYANVGDQLVDMGYPAKAQKWFAGLARIQITNSHARDWRVKSDFVDVDGDGLEELFDNQDFDGDGHPDYNQNCEPDENGDIGSLCGNGNFGLGDPLDGQGMRMLRTVRNPIGGEVSFEYAPIPPGTDGGRVPHALWVVTRMTANAGLLPGGAPAPDQVTRYDYRRPVYNQDDHDQWGFRGFEEVAVTDPAGAHTVTRYDHSQSFAGLPVEVAVYDAPDAARMHTVTATSWQKLVVASEAVWTFQPDTRVHRICGASQSPDACRTSGAVRRERHQYVPVVPFAEPTWRRVAHTLYGVHVGETEDANADETTDYATYRLVYGPDEYRILPEEESRWENLPSPRRIGLTRHLYDAEGLVEIATHAHAGEGTIEIHARAYDIATGNVTDVWRPKHFGTTKRTHYTYDAQRMFVETATNELGHEVKTRTDLGTGIPLQTWGPNSKSCGTACTAWEGGYTLIDGLGRPRERWVRVDDSSLGYRPELVQRWEYVDAPAPGTPVRVASESRIEYGGTRWVRDEAEMDGLGRVIRTRGVHPSQPAAVSSFHHDARGLLVRADVPRPSATDSTTVRYQFARDSHGRIVQVARPDMTGVVTFYDGLRSAVAEVVSDASPASYTILVNDVHGRLREVHERLDDDQGFAVTTYSHDRDDNVIRIDNPDGVVTEMTHDWMGRRLSVTRAGRTWSYGYDPDGKLITIQAPAPDGHDPLLYLTSIVHDDLGRPISRVSNARGLSEQDLAELGSATAAWTYDQGANGLGRMTSMDTPSLKQALAYDALGRPLTRAESFTIPGVPIQDGRTARITYNALGPLNTYHGDGSSLAPETRTRLVYDDRGRPDRVRWMSGGGQELARNWYTTGGNVYQRTDTLASPMVALLAQHFDNNGRLVDFRVQSRLNLGTGYSVRAHQTYQYHQSGDLKSMTSKLAPSTTGATNNWTFGYDDRHQLLGAKGPLGYSAEFGYTPAGKLDFADVTSSVPSLVATRAVMYAYDAEVADPDAVVELTAAGTAEPWASYQYDPSGNVTMRRRGSREWQHVYDGADLQRKVVDVNTGRREVYFYDANRQRRLIVTRAGNGVVEKVRWLFGDAEIHYNGNGSVTSVKTHVNLDGPVARIVNGQAELLFHNHLDHLIVAVDRWGRMKGGFTYTPFGEILEEKGSAPSDLDRTFNDKQEDDLSDLSYYGARYYDPVSLTWTQADPLYRFVPEAMATEPRRTNLYTFSLNNPLRYVDPDGLEPKKKDPMEDDVYNNSKVAAVGTIFAVVSKEFDNGSYAFLKTEYEAGSDGITGSFRAFQGEAYANILGGRLSFEVEAGGGELTAGRKGWGFEVTVFKIKKSVSYKRFSAGAGFGVGAAAGCKWGEKCKLKGYIGFGAELEFAAPDVPDLYYYLAGVSVLSAIVVPQVEFDHSDWNETASPSGETESHETRPTPRAEKKKKKRKPRKQTPKKVETKLDRPWRWTGL